MNPPWYRDFFEGVALDLWRKANPAERTASEVDWLIRMLGAARGARLLDVPCGNGRHAIPLAERGYALTGIDLSEEFLREARERTRSGGLRAEFVLGDMAEIADAPVEGPFDGAFCMGNSFGYLEHEATERFLSGMAGLLRPGGRFCLDTGMTAESILVEYQGNRWMRVDDILLAVENRYDAERSRLETEFTFVRDGRSETRSASHAVYTVAEIRRLLDRAGLATRSIAGGTAGEPFRPGCQRLLLVAEKR